MINKKRNIACVRLLWLLRNILGSAILVDLTHNVLYTTDQYHIELFEQIADIHILTMELDERDIITSILLIRSSRHDASEKVIHFR
jgi:hypothetical protein